MVACIRKTRKASYSRWFRAPDTERAVKIMIVAIDLVAFIVIGVGDRKRILEIEPRQLRPCIQRPEHDPLIWKPKV